MRVEYYSNQNEKKKLKKEANNIGESTIHDDYIDKYGKPTDGNSGRLTFGIKEPPSQTNEDVRIRQLNEKIKSGNMTHDEIIEFLKLNMMGGI